MSEQIFPPGWDQARVQRVIDHYENMSEDELLAEDEAARKAGKSHLPVPGAVHENGTAVVKGRRKKPKAQRSKPPKSKSAKRKSSRTGANGRKGKHAST
jgi:hypothetical protein